MALFFVNFAFRFGLFRCVGDIVLCINERVAFELQIEFTNVHILSPLQIQSETFRMLVGTQDKYAEVILQF